MITPEAVQALITARIAALVPDVAYAQDVSAWTESRIPLVPEWMPDPATHLCFYVDDRELRLMDTHQNGDDEFLVDSPIRVRFLFRLRPTTRRSDWVAATTALRALWKQLMNLSSAWSGEVNIRASEQLAARDFIGPDGGLCIVTLNIFAQYSTEAV